MEKSFNIQESDYNTFITVQCDMTKRANFGQLIGQFWSTLFILKTVAAFRIFVLKYSQESVINEWYIRSGTLCTIIASWLQRCVTLKIESYKDE